MTREPNKNPAASIRAKLLSLSREKGEDYQRVLGRFAIERFLYRLSISPYRDRFVLKGATLFTLWTGETHRPTKDLDLLGWGSSVIADVEQVLRDICESRKTTALSLIVNQSKGRPSKRATNITVFTSGFALNSLGRKLLCRSILDLVMRFSRSLSWRPSCASANVRADHSSLSTRGVDCGKAARDGSARHPQ